MIRVAVAGLGFMGARHIRALRSVPGASLSGVVSGDERKLTGDLTGVGGNLGVSGERFDFSGVRKFHTVQAAIEDAEIDAIDICLPTDRHFAMALAAIQAGKHVFVEKPIALRAAEAGLLVEAARRSGRILMVGHVLRYFAEYQALWDILKFGHLGPVRSAFFRRRCGVPSWSRWLTDEKRSGGAVMDLLIHDIDFCLHLFGMPEFVSAVGFSNLPNGIDWVEARLMYPDIGPVILTGGWQHPQSYPFSMEFTVMGDRGTLELPLGSKEVLLYSAKGTEKRVAIHEEDPWIAELSDFIHCAGEGKWPERCPPEDSARAVLVAECIKESRGLGGETLACRSPMKSG